MSELSIFSVTRPLVIVGCGKMSGSLLTAWLKKGVAKDSVLIIDPNFDNSSFGFDASQILTDIRQLPTSKKPKMMVLGIKPQIIFPVLATLKDHGVLADYVVSIVAGIGQKQIADYLPDNAHLTRIMPNTPSSVGEGVTAAVKRPDMGDDEKSLISAMMNAAGKGFWVDNENELDMVTGVSGSGPAYVFHMVEALAAAGVNVGLEEDQAMAMARQTIIGAAKLLSESDEDARQLRRNVTSPNGTTEAGLNVLMADDGLGRLMRHTVKAAIDRAKELSKEMSGDD